jgi:tripartite-type tricarboxylate transporter receptor subunit TctC
MQSVSLKQAGILATAGAFLVGAQIAWAQEYPTRSIRMIIPFSAGGATDVPSRVVVHRLGERLGQQIVVDNRPGAGGALGASMASRANADGYTVLMTSTPFVVSPHMYKKLDYDPLKDFVQVTQFGAAPNVLVIHPSLPAKNVKELISHVRGQPGKLEWASSGTGGGQHLFGELFMSMAKLEVVHVPHKGSGPTTASLLGGHIKIGFPGIAIALGHHRAGRLLALGVTTAERSSLMPDVPTIAEAGLPGYEATFWFGLSVPTGTPQAVINRLHKETIAVMKESDVIKGIQGSGTDPAPSDPKRFRALVLSEYEKWGKVIREAGLKPN